VVDDEVLVVGFDCCEFVDCVDVEVEVVVDECVCEY